MELLNKKIKQLNIEILFKFNINFCYLNLPSKEMKENPLNFAFIFVICMTSEKGNCL